MLIPMYLSIGIWGDKQRAYAAMKFFIFMFLGSIFMLLAILYLSAPSAKSAGYFLAQFDFPQIAQIYAERLVGHFVFICGHLRNQRDNFSRSLISRRSRIYAENLMFVCILCEPTWESVGHFLARSCFCSV